MNKKDYYYDLPQELIAQVPLKNRSDSRLMTLNRKNGEIEHHSFTDILDFLQEGDVLVRNNSRVIPARLFGIKKETGAHVELLLLRQEKDIWECLVGNAKVVKLGTVVSFGEDRLLAKCTAVKENGLRDFEMIYDGIFNEILEELGETPLPPYIHEKLDDKNRYQTVYAVHNGSAAAPTAGLHFTNELLDEVQAKGVKIARVTLHVGLGTFRPAKVDNILEHHMHSEYYTVTQEAADIINETRANGGRVVCVGTTSTRTVESVADEDGHMKASSGWTDIFIYPGYKFRVTEALITNFHLPESTLLMLVSSLAGREHILAAYEHAVREEYRFFSFGDAMLIK